MFVRRATETLAVERNAFETEKKEHAELYQQQQSELQGMLERHRTQNEEWLEKTRAENDADRKELAEQKVLCVEGGGDKGEGERERMRDVNFSRLHHLQGTAGIV